MELKNPLKPIIESTESKTVLLVDDDSDQLEIFRLLIERGGHNVITAESASAALEILASIYIDVVVCDVMMPGIDGREFIKRARKTRGMTRLPVISFTAASNDLEEELLEVGADKFCAKKDCSKRLLQQIRALTSKQGQAKSLLLQIQNRFV